MPEDNLTMLAAFQHADSVFPSGAVSFSWGLEALYNRNIVTCRDHVFDFAATHIQNRWANLDRVMMLHAHRAGGDMMRIAWLDSLIEAQSLSAEQRLGSSRMGAAFLGTHRKLLTDRAADYTALVNRGEAHGHLPIVQGMIWDALGFDTVQIQLMAAHGICTGLLSAAVRLSIIGHVDAQGIHTGLLALIEDVVAEPVCEPEHAHSFIPQIEIASMHHETDEMRLFVN